MDEIVKYFPYLPAEQVEQLRLYGEKLLWWNERINLISRQDTENITRHILHSLVIARCFQFQKGAQILDLGTGGGLPGIPLAIVFPDCRFTLIDSRGKKIKAVQAMVNDLQLKNVKAIHTRAEELSGVFDFVVSRAVANLKELWEWSLPLLKFEEIEKAEKMEEIEEVDEAGEMGEIEQIEEIAAEAMQHKFEKWQAQSMFGEGGKTAEEEKVEETEKAEKTDLRLQHQFEQFQERTRFGEGGKLWSNGLIALKGGDLKQEIKEAEKPGIKIEVIPINGLFRESYFEGKYVVYVSEKV